MKIKKEGKIPPWQLDVTCKFCKTVITLESADDMYKNYDDTYYCDCPKCSVNIRIARAKIRWDIMQKVKVRE